MGITLGIVATFIQILPVAIVVGSDRPQTRFRRVIALWCLTLFAGDTLHLVVGAARLSNLWLGYVVAPAGSAVALWALSLTHPSPTARTAFRIAIPLLVATGAVLTFTIDDPTTFSLVSHPLTALVVLLAAAWTFVSHGLTTREALTRQDWFWIVAGVMLYAATTTALQPVSWFLQANDRPDLLGAVYPARAAVDIVGFIAVAWGMLCPVPPLRSGGSSSPLFSPQAFS